MKIEFDKEDKFPPFKSQCYTCHGIGYVYVTPEGISRPIWECPTDSPSDTRACFVCGGTGQIDN